MRKLVLVSALCLSGCATPYDPTPDIHDVSDQKQVAADKSVCILFASSYHRPFDTQGIVVAGAEGTTSNLGLGAGSWLAPFLGGLGGILTSTLQYLGVVDVDTARAYQQCLRQRFDRDHSAILVEPPL